MNVQIEKILAKHMRKAEATVHDAKVAILAVGSAAQLVQIFTWSGDDLADLETLVQSLDKLRMGIMIHQENTVVARVRSVA
jgi:hypothetical protein